MRSSPVVSVCLTLAAACFFSGPSDAALKPGDRAPAFTVQAAQGGKVFTFGLADALKKGPVVVYFYPKSFTSVCTAEAHAFAENIQNFRQAGASVIGMSGDGIDTQREFSAKECRDKFPVGADPDLAVTKAYDATAIRIPGTSLGFADRISYVVAPGGKIIHAYEDSEAESHITNALTAVRAWAREHKR